MVEQMPEKNHLIEFAFPLKQTSIDSVHEENVRQTPGGGWGRSKSSGKNLRDVWIRAGSMI
jgi:hypothetical protein